VAFIIGLSKGYDRGTLDSLPSLILIMRFPERSGSRLLPSVILSARAETDH